jgi:hypothetical protein
MLKKTLGYVILGIGEINSQIVLENFTDGTPYALKDARTV